MNREFKVGDKVKVDEHISIIVGIANNWYILETKHPNHCCNYYYGGQLELVE